MYNHFFGFKERPFKLVPDPDYLFLSPVHEEALAHLKYAVTEGDGFVEIIGEVGTGKTMLCRAFLESLGPGTETAYIFNPKMDAIRLLQAINSEFGIPADSDQIKALIDTLNAFLIEKKKAGSKVLLIVDEAQNLEKDVLEQLRLLSNLETTKEKLLQIILVGQPELGEMLDSYELRQLGQRISLSCRLRPLTLDETRNYIRHRLNVAAQKVPVRFTRGAFRRIYRFSRGIPRLINIACDRALLVAYGMERKKIDSTIARTTLRELYSRGEARRMTRVRGMAGALAAVLLVTVLAGGFLYRGGHLAVSSIAPSTRADASGTVQMEMTTGKTEAEVPAPPTVTQTSNRLQSAQAPEAAEKTEPAGTPPTEAPSPEAESSPDLAGYLADATVTPYDGMARMLDLWDPDGVIPIRMDGMETDPVFFTLAARQNGLSVLQVDGDLSLIRKLNLPAILMFETTGRPEPVYLAVKQADADTMTLCAGTDTEMIVPNAQIAAHWSGTAFVFWKDFLNLPGVIGPNTPPDAVIALKMHLREIGWEGIAVNGDYDIETFRAIKQIQAANGIYVDGQVGPMTKIVLYNRKPALSIPLLSMPETD